MSSIFTCDLGLNRKTLPHSFFCCFVFAANAHFADSIVWENKSFLWKQHHQEKKLHFCILYLWKMKEEPANLNREVCFSLKWKATCKNWAHLDEEKKFGPKSHLRGSSTQPFNWAATFLNFIVGREGGNENNTLENWLLLTCHQLTTYQAKLVWLTVKKRTLCTAAVIIPVNLAVPKILALILEFVHRMLSCYRAQ